MPKETKKNQPATVDRATKTQLLTSSDLSEEKHVWSRKRFGIKIPIFILILLGVIVVLGLLGFLLKDKFLVATINGRPVFRYELDQRLTSTYGKEALENLIVEKLIKDEAKKRGVNVSEKDVEEEAEKIEKSLGEGVTLKDALSFQGVSLSDFKEQLKLRLQLTRMLEGEVTVSEEEVDTFLKDNAKTLVVTGEAEQRAEAREKVKEQKINSSLQGWVEGLLAKAKITRFLK